MGLKLRDFASSRAQLRAANASWKHFPKTVSVHRPSKHKRYEKIFRVVKIIARTWTVSIIHINNCDSSTIAHTHTKSRLIRQSAKHKTSTCDHVTFIFCSRQPSSALLHTMKIQMHWIRSRSPYFLIRIINPHGNFLPILGSNLLLRRARIPLGI